MDVGLLILIGILGVLILISIVGIAGEVRYRKSDEELPPVVPRWAQPEPEPEPEPQVPAAETAATSAEPGRHPMTGNQMSPTVRAGIERHSYDVVVIGAGGSGLRAAIAAHEAGARTAIVCKSLLGKAHTVMAEGGIAAAMGNRWPEDNWQVHFRDTMRGGKFLNVWRMAELHAKQAPDRVRELEE